MELLNDFVAHMTHVVIISQFFSVPHVKLRVFKMELINRRVLHRNHSILYRNCKAD